MTSDPFHVDLDHLDTVVGRLGGLSGFLTDCLTELDRRVQQLHSSGSWTGRAARAHADAHREWSAAAAEFNKGVADLQQAARKAHQSYTDAGTANSRILRSR